jgi:hypothetical protein
MSTNVLSLAPNTPTSQATPFLGTCKRCASADLFIKQQGPHFGLFCRQCELWQKWIKHSKVRRLRALENVPLTVPTPVYKSVESISPPAVVDTSDPDVIARLEKLELAFAGYDSQLGILVRAIFACGVLQGAQSPPLVNVDDERVDRFVREVSENE